MKTNYLFMVAVFFLLIISSGCNNKTLQGSGNIITENRNISSFDRIIFSGIGEMTIEQGNEESLTVRADDNILPYIHTEVENNALILGFVDSDQIFIFNPTDEIQFYLTVKNLSQIDFPGAGSIKINNLETEKLIVDLSGTGNLEVDSLNANELIVLQRGAGTIFVSGQVKEQDITHSGSGSYHAADLISQTTIIKISGAGDATIWAVETLDVEISGLGNVTYHGYPRLTKDISGMGELISTIFLDERNFPMAIIPSGPFEMGGDNGTKDEQPVHTVILDDFYIDLYEITNSQYALCEDPGICEPTTDTTAYESSYSRRIYYGNPKFADYPVIYASWDEAQKFCEWRGGRLPTEAEWEKAARGGLKGETYPWGDESPVCETGAKTGAKFDDDGGCNDTDTEQVGSYSPNGYGLYDMAGNLWEWVSDFYDENYFANSPANNPTGPKNGIFSVLRGGSWDNGSSRLRVSDRRFNDPNSGALNIGFRCVRTDTTFLPIPIEIPGSMQASLPSEIFHGWKTFVIKQE